MLRRLAVLLPLLGAMAGPSAAAAASATSSNWAGYVASASRFSRVSATWVQPSVSCTPGSPTYMASWVGLGGSSQSTNGLEQVGTEADCSSSGRARYSSWYELVPSAAGSARLRVRPGDVISASVTVSGENVRLRMANDTLRTVFHRRLRARVIDVSSADWIVEAPSVCATASDASCHATTLADFSTTGFSAARATAAGHSGTLADAAWSTTAVTLVPGAQPRGGPGLAGGSGAGAGTAAPSGLAGSGDAFSISFGAASAAGGGGF